MQKQRLQNYLKQLVEDFNRGASPHTPGQLTIAHVYHDDWCAIFTGGICNCNPEIKYERAEDYARRLG